jgi:hypothetical protein
MQKNMVWIAVGALALAVFALGGAWLLMGPMGVADFAVGLASARLSACSEDQTGKTASRTIAWDGSEMAATALPAMLRWQPGSSESMQITGDAALLPHIKLEAGEIKLDCRPGRLQAKLDITLPGAHRFRSFALAGVTSLSLSDVDQPDLHFDLAGSSTVTANGRADTIQINAAGLSDANLGKVAAKVVHLNLAGASKVEVAPEDRLSVNSAGATTVTLRREPKSLTTNIMGEGRVIHNAESQ